MSISNTNDSPMPVAVTLLDPGGEACVAFGDAGTTSFSQGQSVSYSGSWFVSQNELDTGRIIYSARFSFQNEEGQSISGSLPISVSITKSDGIADLDIMRVPPTPMDGLVTPGQTVMLRYQLKNIGTIDLTDIAITDHNIFSDKITVSRLAPGEIVEVSYSYVADASAKTSEPVLTYQYENGGSVMSKSIPGVPYALSVTASETEASSVTLASSNCFTAILAFCMFVVHAYGWKGGVR